eukprot:15240002-Alexandrium_andersonii.AAC.1
MSASLVGSEMCIRDRPPPQGPPRSPWGPLPPLGEGGGPGGQQPPQDAEAVSYTHLTLPTICSV